MVRSSSCLFILSKALRFRATRHPLARHNVNGRKVLRYCAVSNGVSVKVVQSELVLPAIPSNLNPIRRAAQYPPEFKVAVFVCLAECVVASYNLNLKRFHRRSPCASIGACRFGCVIVLPRKHNMRIGAIMGIPYYHFAALLALPARSPCLSYRTKWDATGVSRMLSARFSSIHTISHALCSPVLPNERLSQSILSVNFIISPCASASMAEVAVSNGAYCIARSQPCATSGFCRVSLEAPRTVVQKHRPYGIAIHSCEKQARGDDPPDMYALPRVRCFGNPRMQRPIGIVHSPNPLRVAVLRIVPCSLP